MINLITGGSGFLGNLLARHLAAQGSRVRVLDTWEDSTRPKNNEFICCNILDREGVNAAMKGVSVVYHLAALVPISKSSRNQFNNVNVEGSRIVGGEAARAGVQCFVHMSSSSVFGIPQSCPIRNDSAPSPIDAYGRSKFAAEQAIEEIARSTGMPVVSIRPRTILGEGRLGIFQMLFDWIKREIDVYTIGSGSNTIQFVHASDLISACVLLAERAKPGIYNIGTDRYSTVRSTLETLIQHAHSRSRVIALPAKPTVKILSICDKLGLIPLVPFHYLTYGEDFYCDLSVLKALGWSPTYSNEEMLCETYDWFIRNPEQLAVSGQASAHRSPVDERLLWLFKQCAQVFRAPA